MDLKGYFNLKAPEGVLLAQYPVYKLVVWRAGHLFNPQPHARLEHVYGDDAFNSEWTVQLSETAGNVNEENAIWITVFGND